MDQNLISLGSDQGLPNLQVQAFELDIFERLWIVGPSGLSCYNGNSIKVYDTRDGLICSGLRTLKIQDDNYVWLGTDRGIELMTIDGNFIKLDFGFDWVYGMAECFLFREDHIWVGTSNALLELKNIKGQISLVSIQEFGLVSKLYNYKDSVLALTSKEGLILYNNGKIEPVFNDLVEGAQITCFLETIDHLYLIGTTNGLYVITESGIVTSHYLSSDNSNKVIDICVVKDQWIIAFTNKVNSIRQDSLEITELETIPIKSSIKAISGDSYGNIWVATNNAGIQKISVFRKAIKEIDCGNYEAVFSVHSSPNKNQLYIGGEGFFSILAKKQGDDTPALVDYINTDFIVWDTLPDPLDPGILWLATQDGIFKRYHNDNLVKDEIIAKSIAVPSRVLLSRDGEIYIGTISGLFCYKDGKVEEVFTANGIKFGYVYSLSLNQNNNIWVSCLGQGLWLETDKGFKNLVDNNLIDNGNTYCTETHSSGNTITLQQENVILIDEHLNSTILFQEFPISGWTLVWLNDETIAIGTDNGLNIINITEHHRAKKINLYLDKSKWQSTSSRSLIHHTNNKLYYGLISGLYFIDLNEIEKNQVAPEVHLNYCHWTNAEPQINDSLYTVAAGKWRVKIDVYSTWYLDERNVNFRFKLAGFDENWTKSDVKSSITYNSLPEGSYEFFVQAYTPLTGYSDTKSVLQIHVEKSWTNPLDSISKLFASYKFKKSSTIKNKLLLEQNVIFKKELQERKQLEDKLERYKQELEGLVLKRTNELLIEKEKAEFADLQKSIFLASMSHEIRTPLSGIIGLVDLLNDTTLNETQGEYINKIDNASKHLLEVINNVLDITKIESGQIDLDLIPFSIIKLLNDISEFSQIKLENKKVDIIIDESIESKHLIIGDVLRIKQILINIIGNALKFTQTGSIIIKIVELVTQSEKPVLQFSVEDTGIGMTKEQVDKLFVAFEQGDKSTAREYGGSGLGLNISQNYVDLMGGTLIAESTPNVGTKFSFTLAFEKDSELDLLNIQTKLPDNLIDKSVIVIDDNTLELQIILRQLTELGLKPIGVQTAAEAIELLKTNKFDIIFMDWYRPDLKGSESIKLLQEHADSSTKIIVINSSNKAHLLVQLIPLEINQVLIKPISKQKFKTEIITSFSEAIETKKLTVSKHKISDDRKAWNSSIKVLVAEDNKTNQLVIKKTLEREGYQTTIVSDGKECVDLLEQDSGFNMIFMDIQMPEMDGIEATQFIRSKLNLTDVPIIAFTADVTKEMRQKISQFGMNGYVPKPIDIKELHTILDKWLHYNK